MRRSKDLKRLDQIAQIIYDKKGFNILALDVKEISSLTEYYLIAEGNVHRHVAALAKALIDDQEGQGFSPYHVEGLQTADWVVIDYGYIIVHIFDPELREKYALEELWRKAKLIDLNIILSKGPTS